MFDVIIEAKYIELVELQLEYLKREINYINKFIILINSEDSILDFKLKILKLKCGLNLEFITFKSLKNKNIFNFLNSNFNENKKYLFISSYISYFNNDFVKNLNSELDTSNSLYFPQILNTERVFYIHQVMGLHKSFTNGRWNNDYIDSEQLLNFDNWDDSILSEINKKYLTIIKLNLLDRLKFDKYYFLSNEILPLYCFAWKNNLLKNNNFIDVEKVILGSSICTLLCRNNLKFEENLKNKYFEKNYECLHIKTNLSFEQLVLDYDYEKQLCFEFDNQEEIDLENKIKKIFYKKDRTIEIKFLINTHANQNKFIYEKLIQDLLVNFIEPKNIYLVIGGSKEEETKLINGVNYHYVKHNSYDHTGLINVIDKNLQSDFWFVMHDTCSVGPNFNKKLLNKSLLDHNPLLEEGWLNMGMFSNDFINKNKNYILSLRNCDKMQAILSEKMYPRLGNSFHLNPKESLDLQTTFDVYGDGIERSVIYFPEIDLYKYQTYYHNSEISIQLFESRIIKKDTKI